jgi:serine/threonine-protein kinase
MSEPTSAGQKSDYSFGQVALRENACTMEQVKECLDIQTKLRGLGIEPKKLGEILIEKGYLSPQQAVQIAKLQAHTASAQKVAIPGYEILSKIGQGAMGTVYRARQVSMDRVVAIKVLSPRYSKDQSFVERFIREARAVAKLNHENIISGIDVGEVGGLHYFVMEYVDGVPVSSIMKRDGRLDEKRCLNIALQIARALAHAHKHGIVHRDIKPENIMITSSQVAKLCDLGLAKHAKDDSGVTMDGTSVGTPNYISPEQARGEENIDIRTDLYSLGASLYHMSTGSPPFSGANPMVVMTKHVTEYPEPPRKRHPGLSEGFSNLVMKMMQKRREDRHQDPGVLIADLEHLLKGGEIAQPAHRPATVVPRPMTDHGARRGDRHYPTPVHHGPLVSRRSPTRPLLIGVGVASAALVAVALLTQGGSPSSPPPPGPRTDPKPPAAAGRSASVEASEAVKKEIRDFREYVDSSLGNTAIPDRFTRPYLQILDRIEHYSKGANFVAQKAWQEELPAYTKKVNAFINDTVWADIEKKSNDHYAASRFTKALAEARRLEEVFKWLRNDEKQQVKTDAGRAQEEALARIMKDLGDTFLSGKVQADQAWHNLSHRDEAYPLLDTLADSGTPDQRADVEAARRRYFEEEMKELLPPAPTPDRLRLARERLEKLRKLHLGNPAAMGVLDQLLSSLKEAEAKLATDASSQASLQYVSVFRPKFEEAMKQRDLGAARRLLFALYFGKETSALSAYFLPASIDVPLLRAYLEPGRAASVESRRLVGQAEEGYRLVQRPGQPEFAKDLYLDLRMTLLLDDLMDQAIEGARVVNRDPNKFKTGYSAALKDAVSVEPAPRKNAESVVLAVTLVQGTGRATLATFVTPRGVPMVTEEDIVALARRAPSAAQDPYFALKAFYLFWFADRMGSAKSWYEKLATPEVRWGMARYEDRLKGAPSEAMESEAKTLYEDAYKLWKKKDQAGAALKFKECVEKYGGTEYMKGKGVGGTRSRLEIVEDLFKLGDPSKPRAPAGGRPGLKEVFAATDVRDLGRGRYEATYTFKDDREVAFFTAAGQGGLTVTRAPGGPRGRERVLVLRTSAPRRRHGGSVVRDGDRDPHGVRPPRRRRKDGLCGRRGAHTSGGGTPRCHLPPPHPARAPAAHLHPRAGRNEPGDSQGHPLGREVRALRDQTPPVDQPGNPRGRKQTVQRGKGRTGASPVRGPDREGPRHGGSR